jgi:glycosyltransferase involved in cell wall biosynthesis
MTIVALSHGYPPLWNMGGEVSLHRSLVALNGQKIVLTKTDNSYTFEGIRVEKINTPNVLNIKADPRPIAKQLRAFDARVVIGQNELSFPAVRAGKEAKAISVVNVHTPPKYGRTIALGMKFADYAIYNTQTSAKQWGEPNGLVLHPPISPLPNKISNKGDAYTLLSSLMNKGVTVVLEMAKRYPNQRFIIVRSPAEPTHGIPDLEEQASKLPNVELHPRVAPEDVYKYLQQTRILLAPSRYETYGMSAIEAAGYGIPSIHVDTPHVREGIGEAAILVPPLGVEETAQGIETIEANYSQYSLGARARAEWIHDRQEKELAALADFMDNIKKPSRPVIRRTAIRR